MRERYYPKRIRDIWGDEAYYGLWKQIECAVLKARGYTAIAGDVFDTEVTVEEIKEAEQKCHHEINGFLSVLCNKIGSGSEKIHAGLTSSDVTDTARMMQIYDTVIYIHRLLGTLYMILSEKAVAHKDTLMCGRTHGQIAEPISFGVKCSRWKAHVKRNMVRVERLRNVFDKGKISGAVGINSTVDKTVEFIALDSLGLTPMPGVSQIIPRDIFAEFMMVLALVSSMCAEIATDIRVLSISGIDELSEGFAEDQKGSSAMPHKKNPITCEQICGLSRVVNANVQVALGNIVVWGERDLTQTSTERIILEESSGLTARSIINLQEVLCNLVIRWDNIADHFNENVSKLLSSRFLKVLLLNGIDRETAYQVVRESSNTDGCKEAMDYIIKKTGLPESVFSSVNSCYIYRSIHEFVEGL